MKKNILPGKEQNQMLYKLGIAEGKKNFINAAFLIDGNHTFLHCLENNNQDLIARKEKIKIKSKDVRRKEFKEATFRRFEKIYKKDAEDRTKQLVDMLYKDRDFDKDRIKDLKKYNGEDIAPFFQRHYIFFRKNLKIFSLIVWD